MLFTFTLDIYQKLGYKKTRTTCFIHVMSLLMMRRVRCHLRDDLWMLGKAPKFRSLSLYKILWTNEISTAFNSFYGASKIVLKKPYFNVYFCYLCGSLLFVNSKDAVWCLWCCSWQVSWRWVERVLQCSWSTCVRRTWGSTCHNIWQPSDGNDTTYFIQTTSFRGNGTVI